jgi:hypothetical protein
MMNTGRFPHTAAAAAVKNVPDPVVSCSIPTILKETWSVVTWKKSAMSSEPVVIIGPSLEVYVSIWEGNQRRLGQTYETVTPAVKDRIKRIANLVAVDLAQCQR